MSAFTSYTVPSFPMTDTFLEVSVKYPSKGKASSSSQKSLIEDTFSKA